MGLNTDCKTQLVEELRYVSNKLVHLENKKIAFEVQSRGEKKVLTPEQIMAFYLKKLKTYFEKAGMVSNKLVISVPTHATNSER